MREWIFDAEEDDGDAPPKSLSVSELTGQIKQTVEDRFPTVWVTGEVTDIARAAIGTRLFHPQRRRLDDSRDHVAGHRLSPKF